jgi:YHS domain-containing protein
MRRLFIPFGVLFLAAAFGASSLTVAQEQANKQTTSTLEGGKKVKVKPVYQTTCPVMGGKINKKYYFDYGGKRIYFCCPSCVGTVKADPEKYIKQLEDQGITLYKTPKKPSPKASGAAAGAEAKPGTPK